MKDFVKGIPGFVWVGIMSILTVTFQTFIEAQWPGTPPAWAVSLSACLVMTAKLVAVVWPTPPAAPPNTAALSAPPTTNKPGKVRRLLLG